MNRSKKYITGLVISILLLFFWIFLTVLLTGGREMEAFTAADQRIFLGFLIAEAATIVLMFLILRKVLMAKWDNVKPMPAVPPTRAEKILRRRSALLLIGAIVLGFGSFILGILYGHLLPEKVSRAVFWSCAAAPVLLGAASVLLRHLYFNRLRQKSVADTQAFLLSHREQAEATAAKKLRLLAGIRRLTHVYALLLGASAFACGFCGGAIAGPDTTFHVPMMWWAAVQYLCALTRLRLPVPPVLLEDDPYVAAREDYPQLYDLAEVCARSQGWDGKIAIRFQDECNAGIGKMGDTCCIYMGVTLLNLLTKEEMQAVFCHEFSHVLREQATDSREIRHYDWLGQGGNTHFLSGITALLYEFPDALYVLQFELYRYADTIAAESAADRAMCTLSDAQAAAAALVKLRYNELFEWETGSYDMPCLYAPEQPDASYLHRRLEAMKAMARQRSARWNALIQVQIQSRSATHPTTKTRLAALGVTQLPPIRFPERDSYLAECEKALSFVAQSICQDLQGTYAEARQENYLQPKAQVEEWETAGRPLVAERYALIDQALRQLGRNLEAEELCRRAIGELSDAAACYAHYMHGCFLLQTYDDGGIAHIYRAMEANQNYIDPGLNMLGEYLCMTGNQEELDRYRQRCVELLQQEKDVFSEMGALRKGDRLQTEQLPEALRRPLVEYIASVDDGSIDRVYLVRKVITETAFTSAVVVKFTPDAADSSREEIVDKLFYYLDTCSDWQFSLFDYDAVAKVKVEAIEHSCIYIPHDKA